jgi:hypothetical protein
MPLGLMSLGLNAIGSLQSGRAGLRRRSGVAGQSQGAPLAQYRRGGLHYPGSAATAERCRTPGLLPQTGRISPKFNHIYASLRNL